MKFNESNIPPQLREESSVVKLVLFLIKEDLPLEYISDRYVDRGNQILNTLVRNKVITYQDGRYILPTALYVDPKTTVEFDVNELRKLFKSSETGQAGLMGDKNTCINRLKLWFQDNPSISMKTVVKATEKYIENCLENNITIRRCENHIYDSENNSTLSIWVEEIEENEEKEHITKSRFTQI